MTLDIYIQLSQFITCFLFSFFSRCALPPYEVGFIVSIWQMRKLRLKRPEQLAYVYTANKWRDYSRTVKEDITPSHQAAFHMNIQRPNTPLLWSLDFSRSFYHQSHWNFVPLAVLMGSGPALLDWIGFHILPTFWGMSSLLLFSFSVMDTSGGRRVTGLGQQL